jgi:hypothetical protein
MMTGVTNSSSTDLAVAAFREVIVPLARAGQAYRLDFTPEAKEGSYFVRPQRPSLTREDLEAMGRSGELSALDALWRAQRCEWLFELVPRLAALAERISTERGAVEATPETPSHLIYQMF